jgi:hypothetical protein
MAMLNNQRVYILRFDGGQKWWFFLRDFMVISSWGSTVMVISWDVKMVFVYNDGIYDQESDI